MKAFRYTLAGLVAAVGLMAGAPSQAVGVMAGADSQLLVGTLPSERESGVFLDIYNAHGISAFEFELPIQSGLTVDTSACLEGLPGTHIGQCVFQQDKNQVLVIVYSGNNDPLPAGWNTVGQLKINGPLPKGGLEARNIQASDPGGVAVDVKLQARTDVNWRYVK